MVDSGTTCRDPGAGTPGTVVRQHWRITGVVQGVGFRPHVHRLASALDLVGTVANEDAAVVIDVQGPPDRVAEFGHRVRADAPPLARIERAEAVAATPVEGVEGFRIVSSRRQKRQAGAAPAACLVDGPGGVADVGRPPVGRSRPGGSRVEVVTSPPVFVAPDVGTCPACLAEVLDPTDRRYRHPFANCTDCGPRYTVIRDLPYDRPATTMAGFAMCASCAAEYADPADRRYHAQPVSCPDCGPQLAFEGLARSGGAEAPEPTQIENGRPAAEGGAGGDDRGAEPRVSGTDAALAAAPLASGTGAADRGTVPRVSGTDAVLAAVQATLAAGGIVALKGLGGYHLVCDATRPDAVRLLRERKGRGDKPFAVMVPDLDAARALADLTDDEAAALADPARPIVLARRRPDSGLAAEVAPGNPMVGVLLAYTPLHHLLFRPVPGHATVPPRVLVATSGNRADEPICFDDDEARVRLGDLADAFCTHDRPIEVPCDDSVVRRVAGRIQPVRRARGFAPVPLALPFEVPPTLAVGGELKNTFCLAAGSHAWVSPHIGDMGNLETMEAFERSVEALTRMVGVEPEVVAADAHPGYLSRRWAVAHFGDAVVEVQHHHAHVASVMAEHGLDGSRPVLGVAFDGTGHGWAADGSAQAWGGEILLADHGHAERVGHLRPLPLPGGDAGVRNPCRVAVAYLEALGIDPGPTQPAVLACDEVELGVVRRQVARDVGCLATTSMGRLFDVVASLLGVRHRVSYEAQAAIELEALAQRGRSGAVRLGFARSGDGVIDPAPVLADLVDAVGRGVPVADLALAFHLAVAAAVVDAVDAFTHAPDAAGATATTEAAVPAPPPVALTGGVFQNDLLATATRAALAAAGHEVLVHGLVPANDGGLSLGQAVVAGRRSVGAGQRRQEGA
ncbi:MAG: carbamoyltransferase HypF [Acidimicrobiales bacterium]|nr:carbamoyltransferase HypF [Acidimicrobiales bacterium]